MMMMMSMPSHTCTITNFSRGGETARRSTLQYAYSAQCRTER